MLDYLASTKTSTIGGGFNRSMQADLQLDPPNQPRKGMTTPRFLLPISVAMASLMATSVHARRRGGRGGEDPFPWLTEFVAYVLIGLLVFAVLGALWSYFTRPSAADLARERSMRRQKKSRR